jgi:predicted nuclease with RNAse H fold
MGGGTFASVGVDLAGVEARNTGVACLNFDLHLTHAIVHTDEEIVDFVLTHHPLVVVVDAPLSLPRGRLSLEEKSNIHLRECDRVLLRRGIRFFPVTLGPMRKLTARGIRLAARLRDFGVKVFEGYPGGAQDIMGIPRKNKGVDALAAGLRGLGLAVDGLTHDELDAVTCAYVGLLYLKGGAELIGDRDEGEMLLPMGSGFLL